MSVSHWGSGEHEHGGRLDSYGLVHRMVTHARSHFQAKLKHAYIR